VGVRVTLNDGRVLDTRTDGFGRVLFDTLEFGGVQPGSYFPTTVFYAGSDRYLPTTLNVTQTVVSGGNHSVAFNGTNGYAETPSTPDLNTGGDWTVEAWFKDEDPNGFNHPRRTIVSKGDTGVSPEVPYFVQVGLNNVIAGGRTGGQNYLVTWDLNAIEKLPGDWHHVAVTFKASINELNLWVDGQHITYLDVASHTTVGNTLPLDFGRKGPITGDYWLGKIDDVRIWNVARTDAEIKANFTAELTNTPAGLVANWRFNEPLGTFLAYSTVGSRTAVLTTTGAAFSTDVHP